MRIVAANWYDETKKILRDCDEINKGYRLELFNHEGYLSLTNERVIFIRVDGFLRKSYKKTLDYLYDEIQEINRINSHSFELICLDGSKYYFETLGIPAIHTVTTINYFKKTASLDPVKEKVFAASRVGELSR